MSAIVGAAPVLSLTLTGQQTATTFRLTQEQLSDSSTKFQVWKYSSSSISSLKFQSLFIWYPLTNSKIVLPKKIWHILPLTAAMV